MPKLTDTQRAQLCGDILSGDRYKDIADRYGVNINTVTHHAKRLGMKPANRRHTTPTQPAPDVTRDRDNAPLTLRGTPPWMVSAICRTQGDPEAFFPLREAETDVAKALCRPCPVRETCLEWALQHKEEHGVWGGLSARERRALAKHSTPAPEEAPAC